MKVTVKNSETKISIRRHSSFLSTRDEMLQDYRQRQGIQGMQVRSE